jgi:hypothetical protein
MGTELHCHIPEDRNLKKSVDYEGKSYLLCGFSSATSFVLMDFLYKVLFD